MLQFVLSGICALSMATAVCAREVTIQTAQGEVSLAQTPQKVAVYDIAAIDTLRALNVTPAGVPDKLYVSRLSDMKAATVGTLFEPDLEALANLAPDLIIVGGRTLTQLGKVAQVAPSIDMTIGTDVISDADARLTAYGQIFNKEAEAAKLRQNLTDKRAELAGAAKGKGTALIVMTTGPKISAFGPGSRFGWMHEASGLVPAVETLDPTANHGSSVSHEFIAQADPDWLFVIDRGVAIGQNGSSAEATLSSPLIEETKAWKNNHVVYLPPADIYIAAGGYDAMMDTFEVLIKAMSS